MPRTFFGKFPDPYFSATPDPDLPIVYPENIIIFPNTVIKGYMIHKVPSSWFVRPSLQRLSMEGWFASVCLIFLLWPISFTPCILSSCYNGYQVAVIDSCPTTTTPTTDAIVEL